MDEQNRDLWDRSLIGEAHLLLEKAARHRAPGPYQLQAAIVGVHAQSASAQETDWREIRMLYDALLRFESTPVIKLNRAVATSRLEGAERALAELDGLAEALVDYRWFHVFKAAMQAEVGKNVEAIASYERALALGPNAAECAVIRHKMEKLK